MLVEGLYVTIFRVLIQWYYFWWLTSFRLGSLCGKGTAFGLQYDRTELGCQIVNKQQFVCKNGVSAKVCFFCRESSLTRVGVFGSPCHCFSALQHSITEGIAYCFFFLNVDSTKERKNIILAEPEHCVFIFFINGLGQRKGKLFTFHTE